MLKPRQVTWQFGILSIQYPIPKVSIDLLEALKLEPSNDSVKSELSSVRAKITETNRLIKERSTKVCSVQLYSFKTCFLNPR